jgi:hypothetical protein
MPDMSNLKRTWLTRVPSWLLPSNFAVWQWTLWLPGQNIWCRHSIVSLKNADLFSTFFTFPSYSHKVSHSHIVSNGSGGSMFTYGAADPCSIPKYFFLITVYTMAMEAVKFILVLSICIYLFSFFLYSHSKMTGVQLFSQCVMTEIKL